MENGPPMQNCSALLGYEQMSGHQSPKPQTELKNLQCMGSGATAANRAKRRLRGPRHLCSTGGCQGTEGLL